MNNLRIRIVRLVSDAVSWAFNGVPGFFWGILTRAINYDWRIDSGSVLGWFYSMDSSNGYSSGDLLSADACRIDFRADSCAKAANKVSYQTQ
mgnify:CR=1 FL=1